MSIHVGYTKNVDNMYIRKHHKLLIFIYVYRYVPFRNRCVFRLVAVVRSHGGVVVDSRIECGCGICLYIYMYKSTKRPPPPFHTNYSKGAENLS